MAGLTTIGRSGDGRGQWVMGEGDFLSFDPFTRAPNGQWGCLWAARTGRTVNGQIRDRVGTPGEFRVRTGVFLPQLLIRSSECVSQALVSVSPC